MHHLHLKDNFSSRMSFRQNISMSCCWEPQSDWKALLHISSRKHPSLNSSPVVMESLNYSGNMVWRLPLITPHCCPIIPCCCLSPSFTERPSTLTQRLTADCCDVSLTDLYQHICVILIPPATTEAYFYLLSVFVFTCLSVKNTTTPRLYVSLKRWEIGVS